MAFTGIDPSGDSDMLPSHIPLHTCASASSNIYAASLSNDNAPRYSVIFDLAYDKYRNMRAYMEDKGVFVDRAFRSVLGEGSVVAFAAVVDGHGGAAVAEYVRNSLHDAVSADLTRQVNSNASAGSVAAATTPCSVTDALRRGFAAVEASLRTHAPLAGVSVTQGAVAAAVVLVGSAFRPPHLLYAANVGDVRVVASVHGRAHDITRDHTAKVGEEVAAVASRGGIVTVDPATGCARVWQRNPAGPTPPLVGGLIPTRSFGDFIAKPAVSAEPDVSKTELPEGTEFLILASDGLWDTLTSQAAVAEARDFLLTFAEPSVEEGAAAVGRRSVARFLRNRAVSLGSGDNITCMVIMLTPPATFTNE